MMPLADFSFVLLVIGGGFSWINLFWVVPLSLFLCFVLGRAIWEMIHPKNHTSRGQPWTPPAPPNPPAPPSDSSALEILRQRYARGEIDAATFKRICEEFEVPGTR